MEIYPRNLIRFTLMLLATIGLILAFSTTTSAQTNSSDSNAEEVAVNSPATNSAAPNLPVFTSYRGISIGMNADEVREKLDGLKRGETQDVLVVSDRESAQIFYDESGTVTAVSVDYFGNNSNAPTPTEVLGTQIQAKPDGSMYQLTRYREAGYWVSYNRTAGAKPVISITMQKF